MDLKSALNAIKSCVTLEGLSEAHRGILLMRAGVRTLRAGEKLFGVGDQSNGEFYLIGEGTILLTDEATNKPSTTSGPGDLFGEIALINPTHSRLRTAKAQTDTQLLVWSEEDLAGHAPEMFARLKAEAERVGFERIARGF